MASWRRFKFYHDAESRAIDFPNTPLCYDVNSADLFFGCEGGEVLILDSQLDVKFAFIAHGSSVLHLSLLKTNNLLLTLGTEEPGVSSATIKVWSIEKLFEDGDRNPQPSKQQKLFSSRFPEAEITAMAVKQIPDGRSAVAVGLASGMVYYTQGDLVKDRLTFLKLNAQPLGSSDRFCVKGVGFHRETRLPSCIPGRAL